MKMKQPTKEERTVYFCGLIANVVIAIAILAFIAGFAMYSGYNNYGGLSLMMSAPFLLVLVPFLKGFAIIIRAAARYLQINGEPYGK